MKRIILLGAPGSGKSTQGQKLAEFLGCPWVSTGELLRGSGDAQIAETLKTARLVDDETVFLMLTGELGKLEKQRRAQGVAEDEVLSAVIDGFPRTGAQAELAVSGLGVTEVIEISVPDEEIYARLRVRGREQDIDEVVAERIEIYERMKSEVMTVFDRAGVSIRKVNGVGTMDEVFERVKEVL